MKETLFLLLVVRLSAILGNVPHESMNNVAMLEPITKYAAEVA